MSVLAKDRKESKLHVLSHIEVVRKEFHRLFTFNFGYSDKIAVSQVRRDHQIYMKTDDMRPEQLDRFRELIKAYKADALCELAYSKRYITDAFRQIEAHLYIANSIYPTYAEELSLRRCHQDEALGICYAVLKELEYIMDVLPVKASKYPKYIDLVNSEINYIKGWKSSNNKFKVTNTGAVLPPSQQYARFKPKAGRNSGSETTDTANSPGVNFHRMAAQAPRTRMRKKDYAAKAA